MGTQTVNEDVIEQMRLIEVGRALFGFETDVLDLHRAGFTAREVMAHDARRNADEGDR